jgi:hypothetical protein
MLELRPFTEDDCDRLIGWVPDGRFLMLWAGPGYSWPLFKDRYRSESARMKGWDYASTGYYFVTICTRGRECWLGNVVDGVMDLSSAGVIVAEEWQKTESIRENVALDEWVIMPNHIHGIIVINELPSVETHCDASLSIQCVSGNE